MRRDHWIGATIVLLLLAGLSVLSAQGPSTGRRPAGKTDEKKPAAPPLPSDPKLLAFHRDFVQKVERLGADYERLKQPEKAKVCYEEILKLVPEYPSARQRLDVLLQREASAERKLIDVQANKGWQETGVVVIPGKPVRIATTGSWTFNMSHELGPTGMQLPQELKDFNLGCLIGVVLRTDVDPRSKEAQEIKPFLIGDGKDFVAEFPGRLMLKMYDSDNSDNQGRLQVEIQGTFSKE